MNLASYLFVSTLMANYLFSSSAIAICNGQRVNPRSLVAQSTVGILVIIPAGEEFCTGTLISKNLILTAAHCFKDDLISTAKSVEYVVYFGSGDLTKKTIMKNIKDGKDKAARRFEVASILVHENYVDYQSSDDLHDNRRHNDIALIHLSEPAPTGFVPVPMVEDFEELKRAQNAILAGVGGAVGGVADGHYGLLRQTVASVVGTNDENGEMIGFGERPARGLMCAGDSGGPAFIKTHGLLRVVGLSVKYLISTKKYKYIAGYESVPAHIKWIHEAAAKLGADL